MKRALSVVLFALFLFLSKAASANTWYIRADGGTRYSANATSGQCDGQADVAYPGSGVNQHCAFNDYRFLYDDQHSWQVLQWVIKGGDTVVLDNTKQWRVGRDQGTNDYDVWCQGNATYDCISPPIPSGTAAQPTRILGRNAGSCSTGGQPDKTKMTQLFGGFAIYQTMALNSSQYVDVECLEITSHAACTVHGDVPYPKNCSKSLPYDDFDGDGLTTDTASSNITLTDLWIHGHTDRGIIGPIGGPVTATRVDIDTNGMAGWDLDRGDATPSPYGSLALHYVTIEWSGCNQNYPSTLPNSCYSQSTGGYGDGMGTPPTNFGNVTIDHSIFRYNTQDGEDFGHILSGGTLTVTNSASYGNNGGQLKWAGFSNAVVENNLIVGNCLRMSQAIPGIPSTFNAHLADFCRAEDAMSFDFNNNGMGLLANNTIVSYAPTTFDFQCFDATSCANTTLTIENNLVLGYDNKTTYDLGGQGGGVGLFCGNGCNGSTLALGKIVRANNLYYGVRGSCVANQPVYAPGTATGESCLNPQLVDQPATFTGESMLDNFNFSLSSSSPAKGGAATLSGLTTDYLGSARATPTSIGGLEYGSTVTIANLTSWLTSSATTTSSSSSTSSSTSSSSSSSSGSASSLPATTTTLTVQATNDADNPATLTVKVTTSGTNGKLRGRVKVFNANNWEIGHGTLTANGTMTWSIPKKQMKQIVYAVYVGNDQYQASTSASVNLSTALAQAAKQQ